MIATILLACAAPAVFVGAALAACLLLHREGDLFTAETWGFREHSHTFIDDECPCGAQDYGYRGAA